MNIIKAETDASVAQAAQIISDKGVILYPTDTLYGLGADALSDEAVAKIYNIKGRDKNKPIHAVVADIEMVREYGELNPVAELLAQHFLPGPLTLILKKREGIDTGIFAHMSTIGIRIPDNQFCQKLARMFGGPITTTSANKSGEVSERVVSKIIEQLGESSSNISLAVDAGELPLQSPSTIVDVSIGKVVLIREGAILASEIAKIVSF